MSLISALTPCTMHLFVSEGQAGLHDIGVHLCARHSFARTRRATYLWAAEAPRGCGARCTDCREEAR